jgi:nicotinamidase/pyrazinamidase
MNQEGIRCIWMGGLALDICVLQSVMDALKAGFQVTLIKTATIPVDPEKGRQAIEDMAKTGAQIV